MEISQNVFLNILTYNTTKWGSTSVWLLHKQRTNIQPINDVHSILRHAQARHTPVAYALMTSSLRTGLNLPKITRRQYVHVHLVWPSSECVRFMRRVLLRFKACWYKQII